MDFSKEKGGKRDMRLLKLLCFICLFCLMPLRAHAAQEQLNSIKDLYVTGFFGDALGEQQIHWQQEGESYYLCMPSGADLSSVKICVRTSL